MPENMNFLKRIYTRLRKNEENFLLCICLEKNHNFFFAANYWLLQLCIINSLAWQLQYAYHQRMHASLSEYG